MEEPTIDKQTALGLYNLFRQENSLWLGKHQQHSQQYFTLIVAILAASIAAISPFSTLHPLLMGLIMIGPLFNVRLCHIATEVCDRAYQAYLEGLSIQSKLEQIIGLTEARNAPTANQQLLQFPKDEYFLPERWLWVRQKFATATEFVDTGMREGANQKIKQTFEVLAKINWMVLAGIAVYAILKLLNLNGSP
jgi:hypothetical protein